MLLVKVEFNTENFGRLANVGYLELDIGNINLSCFKIPNSMAISFICTATSYQLVTPDSQ